MTSDSPFSSTPRDTIRIDSERCTGCAACVAVCPEAAIQMAAGTAVVAADNCMTCAHCAAACPADCITVDGIEAAANLFHSFAADSRWLPHGQFDTGQLVRLMASRRSCRHFTDRLVPREMLADLVNIGITAPSGTNSQKWTFTLVATRSAVTMLGDAIAGFFRRLNRKAENPVLRWGSNMVGGGQLARYYRDYYPTVKEGLDAWYRQGCDRLFHGAPALIIVGSAPGASCPSEDALLATQNILLGAHAMGLGTCLIGYAVAAMQADTTVQQALGIPEQESIHAVIAVGFPSETYIRTAGRRSPTVRWVSR